MTDKTANRGAFHHIDLSVTDVAASKRVYGPVLEFLGYQQMRDTPDVCEWDLRGREPFGASLGIRRAKNAGTHDGYAPGLQHLAWRAVSRDEVDRLHDLLIERGIVVLDPPAAYPQYSGDYYAVFFADPDGIRLEWSTPPAGSDAKEDRRCGVEASGARTVRRRSAMLTKLIIAGLAGLTSMTAALPADARIVGREHRQQARIYNGVRTGELTRRETLGLERREARTDAYIARSRADSGGLSYRERYRIERMQDRDSRAIYRQKHD